MQYLQQRQEVLQAAKEIYESQLVTGTWGNVSVAVPDQSLLLITPSGMDYNSLSIEDIALVDWEQKLVEGRFKPSVETPLHLEIYKKRPDIKAIVHVHSLYATAFAVARQNIPVILEETAQVIGHEIRVTSYAPCGSKQLAETAMKALGKDRKAVLLANHGLVGMGENIAEALKVCYIAEKTAHIAICARPLGPLHSLRAEDIAHLQQSFKQYGQKK